MDYDKERDNLLNKLEKLLIDCKYTIIDKYINEWGYGTSYSIITNKITIDLDLIDYHKNKNSIFDEINIYDERGEILKMFELNDDHKSNQIFELVETYLHQRK